MNTYLVAVSAAPELPQPKDIPPITEWSVLAVIAVLLIRNLLAIDKSRREADAKIIEKLLDEVLEDN